MRLLKRLQLNFAAWLVPLACAVFGSGFGVSQAILACETPPSTMHTDPLETNVGSGDALEQCDGDLERLLADIDGDGSVDAYDFVLFLAEYGASGPVAADINDDGQVDAADFAALIRQLNS